MDDVSVAPKLLSFQLLEEITNGFSEDRKVGAGSYGNVYKGEDTNGEMIAVKVLHYIPGLNDEQFEKEYHNLASLQHKNIVRLLGYCHETRREFVPYNGEMVFAEMTQRALCFEYMQNGSLDGCLTDESTGHDWRTRYAIIKGICQGLKYLHEELNPPMYHLDLKPANVLLDENMVPKIADFGLSRLLGGERTQMTKSALGTHGYVPPEYIDSAIVSVKFDIYSLGVVIIKIMTGPKGYFRSAEMSPQQFVELVHGNWKSKLRETLVHGLSEPYSEQVKICVEIALSCVDADRHKRPTIGEIINMLNQTDTLAKLAGTSANDIGSTMYKVMDFESKFAKKNVDFQRKQAKKQYAGSGKGGIEPGSMQLVMFNNKTVPLSEYKQRVMLELTGGHYSGDRPGLDLVAVLDVSGSNQFYTGKTYDWDIEQFKIAMRFVVRKLSPMDRLSIIAFSGSVVKLCPLRQITEASRREIEGIIDSVSDARSGGHTNIEDALLTALSVLANRKVSAGRVVSIMLMSHVKQSRGKASKVIFGDVPVYTFGFGMDSDPNLLSRVAANSMGGAFFHFPDSETDGGAALTMALSQCLAALLTVSVQDLELTVAAVGNESRIVKLTAGSYPQKQEKDADGPRGWASVAVRLGNLCSKEVRNVIVDLRLPAVQLLEPRSERNAEILKVTYSYRSSSSGRQQFLAPPETLTVCRTGMEVPEEKPVELQREEAYLRIADDIRVMRQLKTPLMDRHLEQANKLNSPTPLMDRYLEQANKFHKTPTMLLQSVDHDIKEFGAPMINVASRKEEMQRLSLHMED